MGKNMKLPLLFKSTETTTATTSPASWPWNLSCATPKTLSFRATNDIMFVKTQDSTFPTSEIEDGEPIEEVIRGLRSERLFFEPGETSSILEETAKTEDREEEGEEEVEEDVPLFKESVAMVLDSWDPFGDFRRSMEEMVEAHGLKDWDCLEELLSCYLRVNGKSNHGYIVGAFVDLLVGLVFASNDTTTTTTASSTFADDHCSSTITATPSFTSPLSFSSSTSSTCPCLSLSEPEDHEIEKSIDDSSSSSDLIV